MYFCFSLIQVSILQYFSVAVFSIFSDNKSDLIYYLNFNLFSHNLCLF